MRDFWGEVMQKLSSILDVNLTPPCPRVCLLGAKVDGIQATLIQRLVALACLSAKRTIMLNWKILKPNCFSIVNWLRDFMDLLAMERAASILVESDQVEGDPWNHIKSYLKDHSWMTE